jgi:hypothetical protein
MSPAWLKVKKCQFQKLMNVFLWQVYIFLMVSNPSYNFRWSQLIQRLTLEPPHRATPAASFLFMPPDRVLLAAFSLGSSSNSEIYFFISAFNASPDRPFNWENNISNWGHNSVLTEHWHQTKAKVKLSLYMPRYNNDLHLPSAQQNWFQRGVFLFRN